MRQIQEHFDDLHFTETRLGKPLVQDRTISIPVQGLLTMAGHPLAAERAGLIRGRLVFRGVAASRRTLTEYIGNPRNPDGFKEDYTLEDLPATEDESSACRLYSFEGLLEDPVAWVDWDVKARSFELIIDNR